MKKIISLFILCSLSALAWGQGTLTGDLMMNLNFFQSDPAINANNDLYNKYLSGSEGWLGLRYNNKGFTVFVRADAFNNSNLKVPASVNTNFGIGAWSVSKDFSGLSITAGYIYDQVGSGILFRSYEDRGLLIDNALVGFELKYKLTDHIMLKGLTGQQKKNSLDNNQDVLSQRYAPVVRVINAEGDFHIGKAQLSPGLGVLNRTLDQSTMDAIVGTLDALPLSQRFEPMYNMYAFTAYNLLTLGSLTWYAEGAYKTHEAIADPSGTLVDKPGNVEYTSIGYARKGLAINLNGKRTDAFVMRVTPIINPTTPSDGTLNWQPIIAIIRPGRLMSRYTPASEDYSEMAGTANVLVSPSDNLSLAFTGTTINTLDNAELYREAYCDAVYNTQGAWSFQGGIQYLEYNKTAYQVSEGISSTASLPMVKALTPFAEATYKISTKKSLRMELEYMSTKEDYGSWVYAILEYNLAPKWSISAADMYNITPNKNSDNPNFNTLTNSVPDQGHHYYNIYTAYTKGPHRFAIAYVKQVDGINCAGGVCRYEPAFSGVKATITSSF